MVERSVLLKGLQHPFLVGLHFSFQTSHTLFFVLDDINGGELFYHLQREGAFPEPRATFYSAKMASALGYLHSLNIVYRDLKPENILLDRGVHVVLMDFGLCKDGVSYLAPEVLLGHAYSGAVDWWGLGSVLYEILHGLVSVSLYVSATFQLAYSIHCTLIWATPSSCPSTGMTC
uniref:Protein kinase domain-containing protein n=1 Tax=Hucho hucho TaxID=62062 RepID=A0A4W5NRU3_9TELE